MYFLYLVPPFTPITACKGPIGLGHTLKCFSVSMETLGKTLETRTEVHKCYLLTCQRSFLLNIPISYFYAPMHSFHNLPSICKHCIITNETHSCTYMHTHHGRFTHFLQGVEWKGWRGRIEEVPSHFPRKLRPGVTLEPISHRQT
jgi:hypothetical protein